jgi:hypothetical protein
MTSRRLTPSQRAKKAEKDLADAKAQEIRLEAAIAREVVRASTAEAERDALTRQLADREKELATRRLEHDAIVTSLEAQFADLQRSAGLLAAPVGSMIKFAEEARPYRVRARSQRFLVCTKPFNLRKTVFYTIVDLKENVRGPENLVFGMGAESDDDCREMIQRLEGTTPPDMEVNAAIASLGLEPVADSPTEVSRRNRIALRIESVKPPIAVNG